jgi:hypothetical protein
MALINFVELVLQNMEVLKKMVFQNSISNVHET